MQILGGLAGLPPAATVAFALAAQIRWEAGQLKEKARTSRVKAWRRRVSNSWYSTKAEAARWIKGAGAGPATYLRHPDGRPTADPEEMHNLLQQTWEGVLNCLRESPPFSRSLPEGVRL